MNSEQDSNLTPEEAVIQFNSYINHQDLSGLESMMTEDHTFIDSSGEVHAGKDLMVAGWDDFFSSYPDYRNHFNFMETRDDQVVIIGHSTCSQKALDGPAIWTAIVQNGLLAEWRVYLDTADVRQSLNLPEKT